MSIALSIIIGVIAGVTTSAIVYMIVRIFNKIIVPWYQQITYNGLDISGVWKEFHDYEGLMTQESTIFLKQKAHSINGRIILVKKVKNEEIFDTKSFDFKGDFYDGFLNITCTNVSRRQIGFHNYLLRILNDGNKVNGIKSWYDIGFEKIVSDEIEWIRKESIKEHKITKSKPSI
jgi:hypothetical protein